jgi:hypothetical protein
MAMPMNFSDFIYSIPRLEPRQDQVGRFLATGGQAFYKGASGNEGDSKKQTKDQDWNNRGNAGLLKSMDERYP